MIVHMLLVKLPPQSTPANRVEVESALALLASVPEVKNYSFGSDVSGRSRGYSHGAIMHFTDRDALNVYSQNEVHLQAVSAFDRLGVERLVLDYETATSGI